MLKVTATSLAVEDVPQSFAGCHLGWRPSLPGWGPSLLGWRPLLLLLLYLVVFHQISLSHRSPPTKSPEPQVQHHLNDAVGISGKSFFAGWPWIPDDLQNGFKNAWRAAEINKESSSKACWQDNFASYCSQPQGAESLASPATHRRKTDTLIEPAYCFGK